MTNPKIKKILALYVSAVIGTIIITLPMRLYQDQQSQIIEIQKTPINQ